MNKGKSSLRCDNGSDKGSMIHIDMKKTNKYKGTRVYISSTMEEIRWKTIVIWMLYYLSTLVMIYQLG